MKSTNEYHKFYLSYSGTGLPLKLVSPIEARDIENRNTFFGEVLDDQDRTVCIHKVVYGEVEMSHNYGYDEAGRMRWAEIQTLDDDLQRLEFDDQGKLRP